ncbi:MAG: Yip1 family protein [Gammaproteobacteria bacterium]|nr:Yip1 family protein [Gammaproteobacteria bacterium]
MPIVHVLKLFANAREAWGEIHDRRYSTGTCLLGHTVPFALIPAIAGYVGTSMVGWQVAGGEVVRLTAASAGQIAVLYFFAMIVAVGSVGWMIRWMATTYGADQPLSQCVVLASFTATPLFLIGAVQAYPILWLNLVVGLPALAFTIYLFYTGVPVMMEIPPERGFLFASAVLAFGLVALVAMLAVTVLLWGGGFGPRFAA